MTGRHINDSVVRLSNQGSSVDTKFGSRRWISNPLNLLEELDSQSKTGTFYYYFYGWSVPYILLFFRVPD